MIFDLRTYIMLGLGVALAGALVLAGSQTIRLASEKTAHAETKTRHAETLRGIANLATKAAEATTLAQQAGQKAVAEIDAKFTKEKADHAKTTEALRADVAAGKRRLRLAATCPAASGGDVPKTASTPSVDDATAPKLTADAESAYLSLRDEIVGTAAVLRGLQQYVTEVCQKAP